MVVLRPFVDDDVHKCGRCQCEFSSLEAFIQHKLQQSCKRPETRQASQEANQQACPQTVLSSNYYFFPPVYPKDCVFVVNTILIIHLEIFQIDLILIHSRGICVHFRKRNSYLKTKLNFFFSYILPLTTNLAVRFSPGR